MSDNILELLKADLMGRGLMMGITNNDTILGRFISQEIEDIYIKYSSITKEEEQLVARLIDLVDEHKLDFDPYQNYDQTKALALALDDQVDIDVIKLYLLLTATLNVNVDLEDVQAYYNDLESKGYVQVDTYLFYYDYGEDTLKTTATDILANDLEDVDQVMELFDIKEIAYMWILKTTLLDAAEQIIHEDGWEEASQIESLGLAYRDKHGCEVSFCRNDDRYLFD